MLLLLLLLLLSRFSRVWLCAIPQMAAHQAPPSLGFSRQEHWSGLPFPSPMHASEKWKWSRSVESDSQRSHGQKPTRLLNPWDFPGKSTGVGCHCQCYFLYFVIKLFQIWPLGLFHLAPMSIWYPLIIMICVFIYVCVNTSVSRNTRFFRLILYVSGLCPEISHSTRSPDIFYCRMNVATKIQVSYVLAASGVFSFPGPFDWWSKEIYVCTLTCKCTCCCSVTELCLALCGPMNCNTPCFPVLHYLPEFD